MIYSSQQSTALTDQYGNYIAWPQVGQITDGVITGAGNTWAIQGLQVASVGWGYIGSGIYERTRSVNLLKTAENNTLASGSNLNVWSPVGKRFRLMGIAVSGAVGGRYIVMDSGTIIMYITIPTNGFAYMNLQNGYLSTASGNILVVQNQTGSQSATRGIAWGVEE